MRIIVAYRGIPTAPGWATGDVCVRELERMGHSVVAYGTMHGTTTPLSYHAPLDEYPPDLLLYLECNDGDRQYPELRQLSCPKAYWTFDDAMAPQRAQALIDAVGFDLIAHANHDSPQWLRHPRMIWLPYGASDIVAERWGPRDVRARDVVLVGTPFEERLRFLAELREHGVEVELIHGVHQDAYLDAIASAKICLNHYASGGNGLIVQRCWDAAGLGVALLTDDQPGMHLFGADLMTYASAAECAERIHASLARGDWLARGHALRRQALERHTMRHRLIELLEAIG